MIITAFNLEPKLCTPGEEMQISFTVKAESGDTINGLNVWMPVTGSGEHICYRDAEWRISAGSSRSVELSVSAPDTDGIRKLLESSRAIPVESIGIQFGNYGTRTNMACEFALLDAWYRPSVEYLALERCTGGVPDDEGESLLADVMIACGPAAKTANLQVRLYYARDGAADTDGSYLELTDSMSALLEGVYGSTDLAAGVYGKEADWNFLLWFGDDYESAAMPFTVARAFANVHMSGCSTGGVCFGAFSTSREGEPKLECHYPAYFYGGIAGSGVDAAAEETEAYGLSLDGKPRYKRVMTYELKGSEVDCFSEVIDESIDQAFILYGVLTRASDGKMFPVNFYRGTSAHVDTAVATDGRLVSRASANMAGSMEVHVLYTKNIGTD